MNKEINCLNANRKNTSSKLGKVLPPDKGSRLPTKLCNYKSFEGSKFLPEGCSRASEDTRASDNH